MSRVTHQTIELGRGKHESPDEGACVMELASMLAGEAFSDHPASVCPVIGSLLRSYNDAVDHDRRQDLYECAALVVGTAGPRSLRRTRAERVVEWTAHQRERRGMRSLLPSRLRRVGLRRMPPTVWVGPSAVRAIPRHTESTHAEVLSLVRELAELGRNSVPSPAEGPAGADDSARAALAGMR
jgi:hypothetical protein